MLPALEIVQRSKVLTATKSSRSTLPPLTPMIVSSGNAVTTGNCITAPLSDSIEIGPLAIDVKFGSTSTLPVCYTFHDVDMPATTLTEVTAGRVSCPSSTTKIEVPSMSASRGKLRA